MTPSDAPLAIDTDCPHFLGYHHLHFKLTRKTNFHVKKKTVEKKFHLPCGKLKANKMRYLKSFIYYT